MFWEILSDMIPFTITILIFASMFASCYLFMDITRKNEGVNKYMMHIGDQYLIAYGDFGRFKNENVYEGILFILTSLV